MVTKVNNRMVDGAAVNVLDYGSNTAAFLAAQADLPVGGAVYVPVTGIDYVLDGTTDLSSLKTYSFGVVVFDVTSGSTAPTHTNLIP